MCGEKLSVLQPKANNTGSPPRVRGKAAHRSAWGCKPWITPACAGKSDAEIVVHSPLEDHPRVCGEKGRCHKGQLTQLGSPPRVRGKDSQSSFPRRMPGITPACAGKRLKKAHKIKDFDPVPIRFHLVFRRFERWCSNLPTLDENVPV